MTSHPNPPPRLGPRPLPLHLMHAAASWSGSKLALPLLRSGSTAWPPNPGTLPQGSPEFAALAQQLAAVTYEDLSAAVDRELIRRADLFATGLEAYRRHPYRRVLTDRPVLWREGSTRLLDFGPVGAPPLLVIPSLVNRSYVLDLAPDNSLLAFLATSGVRPLLVDWDEPGVEERGFGLTEYIAGRLDQAFEVAAEIASGQQPRGGVHVLGYCMGGLLALALAERKMRRTRSLTLLATPWDFHAEQPAQARLLGSLAAPLAQVFAASGVLPVEVLQSWFFMTDPAQGLRKFSRLATLDPASSAATRFVAIEDWVNDGIPLALPTARECLADWYGANAPAAGSWRIAGHAVDPTRLDLPVLAVLPNQDRIVPPASAAALADRLPRVERLTPSLGHVGMVVGPQAKTAVWRPIAAWLKGIDNR
ncbi:MAG TPA: alpha/beta fold hydrolase [Stellaceae bacterium]|nr:alpha/beta fold hydrolase [Stellaceae bacterium]